MGAAPDGLVALGAEVALAARHAARAKSAGAVGDNAETMVPLTLEVPPGSAQGALVAGAEADLLVEQLVSALLVRLLAAAVRCPEAYGVVLRLPVSRAAQRNLSALSRRIDRSML